MRQLYRAVPSTAELDAVLEEQSQTIPLLPDRHRATVLAEETTIGWTVAVNLTSRSPSGIEYTPTFLGSTVYETIRDATAATPAIVVMIAPLGAPPTQHAPADPAPPDVSTPPRRRPGPPFRPTESFNLLADSSGYKADLFVVGDGVLDRRQLERRVLIPRPDAPAGL